MSYDVAMGNPKGFMVLNNGVDGFGNGFAVTRVGAVRLVEKAMRGRAMAEDSRMRVGLFLEGAVDKIPVWTADSDDLIHVWPVSELAE